MRGGVVAGGVEWYRSYARIVQILKLSPGRRALHRSARVLSLHATTATTDSSGSVEAVYSHLFTLSAAEPRVYKVGRLVVLRGMKLA
jgi:hypothetical protein